MTLEDSRKYPMPFGRHKGQLLGDIFDEEPDYITGFLVKIPLRQPLSHHVRMIADSVADQETATDDEPSAEDG